MILTPYFIERTDNWVTLGIFLSSGGRQAWHIEPEKDKGILKILKDNGFPCDKLEKDSQVVLAKIDRTRLQIQDFYMWEEVDPETSEQDIWRSLKIPVALWSCQIFRENFYKSVNLPSGLETLLNKV